MSSIVEYYRKSYIKLKKDIGEINKNHKKEMLDLNERFEKFENGDENALTKFEKIWAVFLPKVLYYVFIAFLILGGIAIFLISFIFGIIYYLLIGILIILILPKLFD